MNIQASDRAAAVIGSAKTAALYFDKVYPFPGREEHFIEVDELLSLDTPLADSLIFEGVDSYRDLLTGTLGPLRHVNAEQLRSQVTLNDPDLKNFSHPIEAISFYALRQCIHGRSMEIVFSEIPRGTVSPRPPPKRANKRATRPTSVLVQLANLNLVDAGNADWKQIIEFRRDRNARIAFSRLRDVVTMEQESRDPSHCADRIATLTSEYEIAAKLHGFECRAAACEVLLSSESLVKALHAGLLGYALGSAGEFSSASAGTLAGTSLVFDVGRARIARKRALLEEEAKLRTHPMYWVFLAKSRLESDYQSTEPATHEPWWSRFASIFTK